MLASQVAMLSRRIEKLEQLARCQSASSSDAMEAQRVAQIVGFPIEILVVPERMGERRQLAIELRKRQWSYERISRVLNCAERTIRRWTSLG